MALSAGTRLGPYEILSPLGAGGMGEVYKARDTRLDRIVAIKVLPAELAADPQFRERFDREARAVAALNHPHICALYDVGEAPNPETPATSHEPPATIRYLVMEYLEGDTLARRLEKGPLPLDQAFQYAIQMADALATAHRAGMTHRDLKPGNVMLAKTGAKLLDFGLAKTSSRAGPFGPAGTPRPQDPAYVPTALLTMSAPLTAQGTILGTFQYMAPEQLEGKEADARTDIFAFGAMVYEMLTGKRAFQGTSHASLIGAIMHADPPPISPLQPLTPPALNRVVQKCLAKEPDRRWQTARDLGDELQWIAETGAPASPTATPRRQRTRERVYAASAFALLLTSIALTAVMLRPARTPAPIRFSVSAPEAGTIDTFALSPDGRLLAFSAGARRRESMLYLRSLDATSAAAIPGTEGARSPFWSPDARFIGFFANGKLKTVGASGGAVRTICDAPGQRSSGDWNREGVILFGTDIGAAIQRVSASGDEPAPVTTSDRRNGHLFPTWLPDGRHFLYYERTVGIHRASTDSKDDILIIKMPTASWAKYVPPGYLVFVRGTELMAQAFDPARALLSGDPVTIGNVGTNYNDTVNGFSVAGDGALAFQTLELRDTELVWFTRSGARASTIAQSGLYANPQLSPDGSRLVVQNRDRQQTGSDVWVVDLARSVKMRVTSEPSHGSVPLWSPDGTHIVFEHVLGSVQRGMFRRLASGSETEEQLMPATAATNPNSYSSDGRYILYTTINSDTNRDVGVLPLAGDGKPFLFAHTKYNETQGQFSPDGKWAAYVSDESGASEIYVQAFPAGGQRTRVSTGGGAQPRWRRDGRELYYLSPAGQMMAVPIQTTSELKVGTPTSLFETTAGSNSGLGTTANYDVTPDGQRFIVVSSVGGDSQPITVVVNWMTALKK